MRSGRIGPSSLVRWFGVCLQTADSVPIQARRSLTDPDVVRCGVVVELLMPLLVKVARSFRDLVPGAARPISDNRYGKCGDTIGESF